jgi:hypothetical protein
MIVHVSRRTVLLGAVAGALRPTAAMDGFLNV